MRFSSSRLATAFSIFSLATLSSAVQVIETSSLNQCSAGTAFTASLFNAAFFPENNTVAVDINGVSTLQGKVNAKLEVLAYGFTIVSQVIDPCTVGLSGFCPLQAGVPIVIQSNIDVGSSVSKNIPGVAYVVPDLDAVVRISVLDQNSGAVLACMEAELSNTKSVYQIAVAWVTAIIAGLGLVASGITSGLGHTNTAAHVAANAVSLFGYFQAQALVGMTSVTMPPIVQSWTQNFQWSMGVIRVGFLQNIATWYQRATGGTPTTYLSTLNQYSVQVQKRSIRRSLDAMVAFAAQGARALARRQTTTATASNPIIVRGIDRVGFRAGIEQTNIFMTGLIFFIFVLFIVAIVVALTKYILEGCIKAGWMKPDKFVEFRNGWKIVAKGILFRLVLLGFVQMSVLCLWELVERDSAAEVVLAVIVFLSMAGALGYASFKVIQLARKSVVMHKNPAYILYSDPECLNKWGFLYVQYRASSYYFILPLLGYILLKAIFVAFAQSSPVAQAVGLIIIEGAALIGLSVLRPFMDKKTNIFNIAIGAVNFVNAVFLLVFSDVFNAIPQVPAIMGVLFALYNVIFAFVLLIMVLLASGYAIFSKNPETRYQPMRDDRGSFIKSQAALTTELDALGATARGDGTHYEEPKTLADDVSMSSVSLNKPTHEQHGALRPDSQAASIYGQAQTTADPITSYPETAARRAPPYDNYYNNGPRPGTAPNAQYDRNMAGGYAPPRSAHGGYQQFRQQQNASPWQKGAGYD